MVNRDCMTCLPDGSRARQCPKGFHELSVKQALDKMQTAQRLNPALPSIQLTLPLARISVPTGAASTRSTK